MSEIDQKVKMNQNAVLLDVREASEYAEGHIPHALNHPLSTISTVAMDLPDHNAEIYVYCKSGFRAQRAADLMKQLGYKHVASIGGIDDYHGVLEK